VRELLILGLIVCGEIAKRGGPGKTLSALRDARLTKNKLR
jgi:hypothetical protein